MDILVVRCYTAVCVSGMNKWIVCVVMCYTTVCVSGMNKWILWLLGVTPLCVSVV